MYKDTTKQKEVKEVKKFMKTTLLIMAAGIGSRFGGGIKQLEPVGIPSLGFSTIVFGSSI